MIFVTVGVQLPFDRLIRSVDEWARERGRTDVFAQIGQSDFRPRHIKHCANMGHNEFRKTVAKAEFLVAHAGIGSIITAMELSKPIIVMPRRADLGEHRNDHQLATANSLCGKRMVNVARDESELFSLLDEFGTIVPAAPILDQVSTELISRISSFISGCGQAKDICSGRKGLSRTSSAPI